MAAQILLAAGPEALVEGAYAGFPVVSAGSALAQRVRDAAGADPLVVVPLTFGRRPEFVADVARTLHWEAARARVPIALAAPLGSPADLVAWLRSALRRAAGPNPDASLAALVVSPAIDPFADAELFRVARLAREASPLRLVEVALTGGDPDRDQGRARCLALGATRVVEVPAVLGDIVPGLPLLTEPAASTVIGRRVADALHDLGHGRDGIHEGLDAGSGHGYAHAHTDAEGHTFTHTH